MELEHTQNLHVVITVSKSVLHKEFCYLYVDWQWKNIIFSDAAQVLVQARDSISYSQLQGSCVMGFRYSGN